MTRHIEFHRVSRDHIRTPLLCCVTAILQPLHGLAQQKADVSTPVRKMKKTTGFMAVALALFAGCMTARAQQTNDASKVSLQPAPAERDGQHDFDFEIGTWKIHLSRLQDRLAGSKTWVKFDGTSVTRKVWDGRANLEEFETDSSTGHIEGLTLRVYNPQTHQWSIYWANSKDPALGQPIQPMVGEFKNGRGEFYDQELWKGRTVYVRFIWSEITPNSAHFEQSYSEDGGKTWEVNWITDQTRDESAKHTERN